MNSEKDKDAGTCIRTEGEAHSSDPEPRPIPDGDLEVVAEDFPLSRTGDDDVPEELLTNERIIEKGGRTFLRIGMALWEIRGRKLYSHRGYQSFEKYCRTHWGFDPSYASRLCCAALLAREIPGDPRQSHLKTLLPAVKGWKTKQGPDFSTAIRVYTETARETPNFTARDLKAKVQALKQETKRSVGGQNIPPTTANGSEIEDAPRRSPQGAADPTDPVKVQGTADLSEEQEADDFRPGGNEKEDNETTDLRKPLVEALGECEREMTPLVKRLRHRLKVSHDDLMGLREAYRHLQRSLTIIDPGHQPAIRLVDLPELAGSKSGGLANDQLVISQKKTQPKKGKAQAVADSRLGEVQKNKPKTR